MNQLLKEAHRNNLYTFTKRVLLRATVALVGVGFVIGFYLGSQLH